MYDYALIVPVVPPLPLVGANKKLVSFESPYL